MFVMHQLTSGTKI